jgi:hypothetical protein
MADVVTGPKGGHRPNTYLAGAAITKARFVKRGADADSVVPATANSVIMGIALDDQDTVGRPVAVADHPGEIVEIAVGAAVALDALLQADANGRAVTATAGQRPYAIALRAASAISQLIPVRMLSHREAVV